MIVVIEGGVTQQGYYWHNQFMRIISGKMKILQTKKKDFEVWLFFIFLNPI